MIDLLDKLTGEVRNFRMKEENMIEILRMFPSVEMTIGRIGGSELWFIRVCLTKKEWRALLENCVEYNYQLIIKENPEDMYFEKGS